MNSVVVVQEPYAWRPRVWEAKLATTLVSRGLLAENENRRHRSSSLLSGISAFRAGESSRGER